MLFNKQTAIVIILTTTLCLTFINHLLFISYACVCRFLCYQFEAVGVSCTHYVDKTWTMKQSMNLYERFCLKITCPITIERCFIIHLPDVIS